jgi:hypothetical protein
MTPQKGTPWGLIGVGGVAVAVIAVVATWFVLRGGDSSTPTAAQQSSTSAAPAPTATASSAPSATAASPTPSATPTPPPAAAIEPTALKGLLASVPELSQIADNATLTPQTTVDAPFGGVTIAPDNCTGTVMPGVDAIYNGSGSTGFAGQVLADASQDHKVIQSIASFATEADAKAFFDKQVAGWQACKFTDVTSTIGGSSSGGTIGVVANTEGTANVFIFPPAGGAGRQCEHAMTPRKNVVVDVRVCAPSVGSMGWTLARDIGQKITGQR